MFTLQDAQTTPARAPAEPPRSLPCAGDRSQLVSRRRPRDAGWVSVGALPCRRPKQVPLQELLKPYNFGVGSGHTSATARGGCAARCARMLAGSRAKMSRSPRRSRTRVPRTLPSLRADEEKKREIASGRRSRARASRAKASLRQFLTRWAGRLGFRERARRLGVGRDLR